jgi:hypothetical protein
MKTANRKNVWLNGRIVSAEIFKIAGMEFSVYGENLAHDEPTFSFFRGSKWVMTITEPMNTETAIEFFSENYQEFCAI